MTSRGGETRISTERLAELIASFGKQYRLPARIYHEMPIAEAEDAYTALRELAATRREALQPVKNVTVTPAHWIPDEPKP